MQMGQQQKIGKGATVDFSEPHKIGDVILPKGSYRIVHRVSGQDHFVEFKQLNSDRVIARVNCRIEPLAGKVTDTAVTSTPDQGLLHIAKVEIAGENVAHIF